MPFKLRGMAYQSPKVALKRRSCCCRHQLKLSKLKLSKHHTLTKSTQLRSRLVLPPALQGVHFEHLLKLGITLSIIEDSDKPPDLSYD